MDQLIYIFISVLSSPVPYAAYVLDGKMFLLL